MEYYVGLDVSLKEISICAVAFGLDSAPWVSAGVGCVISRTYFGGWVVRASTHPTQNSP